MNRAPHIAKFLGKHLVWPIRKEYHKLHNFLAANSFGIRFYDSSLIRSIGTDCPATTDISDHLVTVFSDIVAAQPKLIVELGTRGGESTKTILAAASHSGAAVLSIDIHDCSGVDIPDEIKRNWTFIQADDVHFEKTKFCEWCAGRALHPIIDVLFIDTSHLYEHTVAEIKAWEPYVSANGLMILHDTNLKKLSRTHTNAILNLGWENERGVMRAIEELVGKRFAENDFFVDVANGWLIRHHPNSFGLTMLKRLPKH